MVFVAVELVSVSIFSIEYVLRIWSRPAASNEHGKTAAASGSAIFLVLLALLICWLFCQAFCRYCWVVLICAGLRILRLMRLLKFSHYSSALEDLFSAVQHEWRSFVATLYLLILAILISSSLIYVFEQNVQPEHFGSIPDAMWWTVVTLTTVGYGDIVPMTVAGKLIATLTALMGVCVVALLTGIVATGFTNQVSMRRNQLEAEITSALSDGVISKDERKKIEDLRQRLNISEQDALAIISYMSQESKAIHGNRENTLDVDLPGFFFFRDNLTFLVFFN